jgi:hypothetical protein
VKTTCFLPLARVGFICLVLGLPSAHAGSAACNLNPSSGDWNTAANLYRYCGNNPANWSDPSGLIAGWDDAALAIGIRPRRNTLAISTSAN